MRIPHLAVPFELDQRGHARTVDQESDEELLQSVRVLIETRPGERLIVPDYGVDDLAFVGPDDLGEEWLADAVADFEPRATVEIARTAIDESGRTEALVEVDT